MTTTTYAISTSIAGPGVARYVTIATYLLISMVKIMIRMMLVTLLATRSHMHMSDVTKHVINLFLD